MPSTFLVVALEELRYPFSSFAEFISGGIGIQSFHLVVGLIGIILVYITTLKRKSHLSYKLALLVVATSPFNNPAYSLYAGFSLSELTGIALLAFLIYEICNGASRLKPITNENLLSATIGFKLFLFFLLLAASIVSVCLWSITGLPYSFSLDNQPLVFIQANTRLLFATLSALILASTIKTSSTGREVRDAYDCLSQVVILIFICQAICYLVLFSGTTPYGTFLGAGFSLFPAFGAVSNERGHLGRLICFFPGLISLLVAFMNHKYVSTVLSRSFVFAPSLIVPLTIFSVILTMSSSSLALMASWLFSLIFLFAVRTLSLLRVSKGLMSKLMPALTALIVVATTFFDGLSASFAKIIDLVFYSEYDGVRALSIESLPFLWGTGYYGSSGRELLPIKATDSGFSVSTEYFGVSYLIFLFLIGAFSIFLASKYLFKTGSSIALLSAALCVQIFVFCLSEVSIGQYSMVFAWFLV